MTPNELATRMFRELSPLAPRLAAAINRALLDVGEGSVLVGLGPGSHVDDPASFTESETIRLEGRDPAEVEVSCWTGIAATRFVAAAPIANWKKSTIRWTSSPPTGSFRASRKPLSRWRR